MYNNRLQIYSVSSCNKITEKAINPYVDNRMYSEIRAISKHLTTTQNYYH